MQTFVMDKRKQAFEPAPVDEGKLLNDQAETPQIAVPETVDVPLPKDVSEQMVVPASINGRDLSQGKP